MLLSKGCTPDSALSYRPVKQSTCKLIYGLARKVLTGDQVDEVLREVRSGAEQGRCVYK